MAVHVVGPQAQRQKFNTAPDWMLKGWQHVEGGLKGVYRTKYGSWWGAIKTLSRTQWQFFLFNPPAQLHGHYKWGCFFPRGENWFYVNFAKPPHGIDEGIAKIESIILEAFEENYER
jgi:hypothetical protein